MPQPDSLTRISIHALREEGDLMFMQRDISASAISIHALREEGDSSLVYKAPYASISIHALREEGDW